MCGLLYLKLKKNFKFNEVYFKNALNLSKYRGPDDQKILKYKNNYFGFNRLSIVGTSLSNQPVEDEQNILIFNGEIYDYDKKNFESDTLNLFEICKNKKVGNLEGQYAFIYFDKILNTFDICRDKFGQKPLYYLNDDEVFIASSTIKSIIKLYKSIKKKDLKINYDGINEYLLFGYFREPNTIFSEIKSLSAGKILHFNSNNTLSIKNYLKKKKGAEINYEKFFIKTIKHSNKNKSLFLSSGVDSNYILTHLIENKIDFKSYTLKNKKKSIDESKIVIRNLENLNIDKNLNLINTQETQLMNEIKSLSKIFELPSSDGLNLFYLFKNLKNHNDKSKIVFSGIGGDEIFGGYNTFKFFIIIKLLKIFRFPFHFFKKTQRFKHFKGDIIDYYTIYKSDPFFINLYKKEELNRIFKKLKYDNLNFSSSKENNYNIIRNLELNEYMKNQLLRDSDNISLFFKREIFNPFLSSFLFYNKIDFKKKLIKKINQFGINLSKKKKGFSIEFENDDVDENDLNILIKNNNKFNIIDNNILKKIVNDKSLVKQRIKICILLFWLEFNS